MDHDWEELPLTMNQFSSFNIKDTDTEYQFEISLCFIHEHNIYSIKKCRNCGIEVYNNEEPKISCDEQQVKMIMES